MVGASLIIAFIFLFAFLWSVRNGQMDDTVTPSMRVLFDDTVKSELPEKLTDKNNP
jgi:cbb3-type cytochrome oxidase maturation protein